MKAFDNDLYQKLQVERINERIKKFNNKLYLEFGGKIFDDYHAARVLPGFEIDTKVKMLFDLKDDLEIIVVINANDIQNGKIRADIGISYENEVLRMIQAFNEMGFLAKNVVITKYNGEIMVDKFRRKLRNLGIDVYLHYPIAGYPVNISKIVSDDGYGKNEYVKTTKPLVVVTAPGPGSGKMATCLSQLYHENKRGIVAGYAKFETFPIWNLPLKHPLNLAYEAATADLNDVNMIDPFHMENYGEIAVNYNRDVEIFPTLELLFKRIYGTSPYKSPTDMGVNMVGYCIKDDEKVLRACQNEVIRRYLNAICDAKMGKISEDVVAKIATIMEQLDTSVEARKAVSASILKSKKCGSPALAIELPDGKIITGKTSNLLTASAAAILNAVKYFSNIRDDLPLISPNVIEPIVNLKTKVLRDHDVQLNASDVLLALAIAATTNPFAEEALKSLPKLAYSEAHSTIILPYYDEEILKKLFINVTHEPVVFTKKIK